MVKGVTMDKTDERSIDTGPVAAEAADDRLVGMNPNASENPPESADEAKGEASSDTNKLFGLDEAHFEAVLIDGILGFSLSFGNAILLLLGAMSHVGTFIDRGYVLLIASLIAAVIFKVVQVNTDRISARHPRAFYVVCHAICFTVALVSLCFDVPIVAGIASAIALADTIILYGRFLTRLSRKALMLVGDSAFLYTGVMIMVVFNMPDLYSNIILAVMVIVTIVVVLMFINRNYDMGELVSVADSKSRDIKIKGNVYTLFLIGFMMGALLLIRPLPFNPELVMTVFGLSFILAAVFSLLIRQGNERNWRDHLLKTLALAAAVLLLPLALVDPAVRLALLACYTCYVVLNSICILDAIIETARFNVIAAMWLLGKECSVYFFGLAAGCAVFTSFAWLIPYIGMQTAMLVLCIFASVVAAFLQIKVNYQVYPFEPVIEESDDDEEVSANIVETSRRKEIWDRKVNAVCEQYHLSPREREILPILLRGRDAKYIMDTFYISQSTAKTHIYNIYRKFGIHSRQELLDLVEVIELMDFGNVEDHREPARPFESPKKFMR